MIPADGVGPDYPESGEKLSLVVSIYRASDFEAAKQLLLRLETAPLAVAPPVESELVENVAEP